MQGCMFEKMNALISCEGNAVPTVSALKRMADYLSKLGFTGMYLNMETMYRIEDEPYFGYMRGQYSKEEIHELDAYCKEKGIELMAGIQTLGHYYFLGKYGTYSDYMDNMEVLLIDDERTYALIEKMFKTISEYFSSRYINIGMDEAFGMGLGKFLARYGYQDRFALMTRHLKRVLAIAEKYGFTCEMWSDMFIHHVLTDEFLSQPKEVVREAVKELMPQNVAISHWAYGIYEEGKLARDLDNHFKLTDNVTYTGALYKWMGFAPDNGYSIRATATNMAIAKACGVKTFNLGFWADWGGEASWFSVLPSLFFVSEFAHGNATSIEDIDKAKFKTLTGVDFDTFMLLDKPNKPHFDNRYEKPNSKCVFYLYNDLLYDTFGNDFISENTGVDYAKSADLLLQADGGEYTYIFRNMGNLCHALALKTELGKNLKKAYDDGDKAEIKRIADEDIPEVIARVRVFFNSLDTQWHKENKPFGFETQCQRIGGLLQRLAFVQKRLYEYLDGGVDRIPELEETRLKPNVYRNDPTEDDYMQFGWNHIVANGWI